MSFVYPLFLFAGLLLAVPVLIHLFNLRKYKTVLFPHTRFLRAIQLKSRKQSQIRHKLLLATRLTLLALLIAAFAQPFLPKKEEDTGTNRLQVIYVDNSNSMGVQKGARSLLEIAREQAIGQVRSAAPGTRFALIANDAQGSYYPETADKVLAQLNLLELTSTSRTAAQIVAMAENIRRTNDAHAADLYYYSDFQSSSLGERPDSTMLRHITFYGLPVQAAGSSNVYIDTAYLTLPVLQTGKANQMVIETRLSGAQPAEDPVLQLRINGQVKSATTLHFSDFGKRTDTFNFSVNDASWQQITLSLNDAVVRFDDSFRITARSSANLSVLVINEGQFNPYIQAAFRAYNGFRLSQADINMPPANWSNYNLIVLNGVTHIPESIGRAMDEALQRGQSICIFPGKASNTDALNAGLRLAGALAYESLDTTVQTASTLQQGSALVKDLFERVPDNVQLPVATWHYRIAAGLTANQQSILSFRNGDPMFARYTPSRGQLYLCAMSADLQSGNFAGSYFFAPFLYQMAVQSGSSNVFAVSAGSGEAVYLPLQNSSERNTIHLYGDKLDVVPPQRPNGGGIDVFPDEAVQCPGFYTLAAPQSDTTLIAINGNRSESLLSYADISTLKNNWKDPHIRWPDTSQGRAPKDAVANSFPIWKVLIALAVLVALLETLLVTRLPQTGLA